VRVTFPSVEQVLTMGPLYNECIYSMTLAEGSWEEWDGGGATRTRTKEGER